MEKQEKKRLSCGEKAPDFEEKSYLGQEIKLSNYKGSKILVSFFRGASCPFCNMRVRELIRNYESFTKNGLNVVCFFNSSLEEIALYAGKQNAPFPIVPDPDGRIYKLYEIQSSHSGMWRAMGKPLKMLKMMTSGFFNTKSLSEEPVIPADFLVDEAGLIYIAHYGKDFGDHIPLRKINEWIDNTK